jgi:hypothetical protein
MSITTEIERLKTDMEREMILECDTVLDADSFYYHDVVTMASTTTQSYLVTTPNTTKWAHFDLEVSVDDGAASIEIYEATDRTGTTLQTVFNRDRNSAVAATTTVHKDVSGGTTDGTRIYWKRCGVGKTEGGSVSAKKERILKQNTKYIVRVTNIAAADNNMTVVIRWYEYIG